MTGKFYWGTDSRAGVLELPKAESWLCVGPHGEPYLSEKEVGAYERVRVAWEKKNRAWVLSQYSPAAVRVNGIQEQGKPRLIRNGDVIGFQNLIFTHTTTLDAPLLNGSPVEHIELYDRVYVIGRRAEEGGRKAEEASSADEVRVDLDMDDIGISKRHVLLQRKDGEWHLEDTSSTGCELNGSPFNVEKLVFGDRFSIRDYVFEFQGDSLQRIDHQEGGAIEARGISKKYGSKTALSDVSLNIQQGEFVGILGLSGGGKSTLLKMLCGIMPPTEGQILVGGENVTEVLKVRSDCIGYVPQDDIVHSELTIREALNFCIKLRINLPPDQRDALVDRTAKILGLTQHVAANKKISELSGGQRKRVSIGIELLGKPSALFLDEPSSGLDPATEEALMQTLQSLTLLNLTVICTTHVLQKAYLFDRLLFIHGGRLIFSGTADEARAFFLGQNPSASISGMFVSPLEKIYSKLYYNEKTSDEWAAAYKAKQAEFQLQLPREKPIQAVRSRAKRSTFLQQMQALIARQWAILRSDWLNVAFLLGQAVVIALLVSWVSDDVGLRLFFGLIASLWFGCSNGAQQLVSERHIFSREKVCGLRLNAYVLSKVIFQAGISCLQAVLLLTILVTASQVFHPEEFDASYFKTQLEERQYPAQATMIPDADDFQPAAEGEVPVEQPEHAQESVADPAIAPDHTVSFLGVISSLAKLFTMTDNLILSGDTALIDGDGQPIYDANGKQIMMPGLSLWTVISTVVGLKLAAYLLAAAVGVLLGLAISSMVRNLTQAVMWVPLVLIPQILFGGFVINLANMSSSVRAFATLFPSNAAQTIVDVSNVYGQPVPYLTNRTKEPMFLTNDGAKETVRWKSVDGELSQAYDKVSPVNTSWQNLAAQHEIIGEHKQAGSYVAGTYTMIYKDTVHSRNDVRYEKGTIFRGLFPAQKGMVILMIWLLASYLLILKRVRDNA